MGIKGGTEWVLREEKGWVERGRERVRGMAGTS